MAPPSAADLLRDARVVLDRSAAIPVGTWGRAVAVLARQAMERALDDYWAAVDPSMVGVRNTRASFVCLRSHWSDGDAATAYYSWQLLSRACHYQSYDVEPSAAEVAELLEGAERFVLSINDHLLRQTKEA
jgi:hypothetical protein